VQKNNALALIGLLAIVFSIFAYNEQTPFPSVYTLIPVLGVVLGVVLLVLYADKETFTAKLLSIKLFVGIGLISYSAYLWHQPMLVFAKLYFNDYVTTDIILAVIATTFVLSWVTWRYIETPFRRGSALTRKYIFFRALIALSAFVVIGLSYHFSLIPQKEVKLVWRGVTHDLPKKFGGIRLNDKNFSARAPVDSCVLGEGEKQIIIIGDSHARVLKEAAYELLPENKFKFVDMSAGACPFFYGLSAYTNGQLITACTEKYQAERLSYLTTLEPSTVVLHSRLPLYLHGDGFDNTIGGKEPARSYYVGITGRETLGERIALIRQSFIATVEKVLASGHDLVIVTPVPTNGWHPAKRLMRIVSQSENLDTDFVRSKMAIPRSAVEERQSDISIMFVQIQEAFPNVEFVDSLDLLCDLEYCNAISTDGQILYADRNHLSLMGSRSLFSKTLTQIMPSSD